MISPVWKYILTDTHLAPVALSAACPSQPVCCEGQGYPALPLLQHLG
jgi:hypothetical protein